MGECAAGVAEVVLEVVTVVPSQLMRPAVRVSTDDSTVF